jgi:Ras-related protein Rab-6A
MLDPVWLNIPLVTPIKEGRDLPMPFYTLLAIAYLNILFKKNLLFFWNSPNSIKNFQTQKFFNTHPAQISPRKTMDDSLPRHQKIKFVLLGDQGVGKTSILSKFMFDTFDVSPNPTVGIDFILKNIYLENRTIKLVLWDTAGQEKFRSLTPTYIKDANVAVIVYDITNKASFEGIEKWIKDVQEHRGSDAVLAVVGNKCDIEGQRQVDTQEAYTKANEFDALFVETSAKTGHGIQDLFKNVTSILLSGKTEGLGELATQAPAESKGETLVKADATPDEGKKKKWWSKC